MDKIEYKVTTGCLNTVYEVKTYQVQANKRTHWVNAMRQRKQDKYGHQVWVKFEQINKSEFLANQLSSL